MTSLFNSRRHFARRDDAIRRWVERVLLMLGMVLLSYTAYIWTEAQLYQAMENRELDAILAAGASSMEEAPAPSDSSDTRPRVRTFGAGSLIGRIEIPRLNVSAVIRVGSDSRTLRLAVGHIPGTAFPGELGNIGLAGHRDTFFRRLRDIQSDDRIRVVTPEGTYTFRVQQMLVVNPADVWVLDATGVPTLTLVTCYPFTFIGSAPRRFVVRAVADGEGRADGTLQPPPVKHRAG